MDRISKKQFLITGYLEYLLDHYFPNDIKIITPRNVAERGSQLSLEFNCDLKEFHQKMEQKGVLVRFSVKSYFEKKPLNFFFFFGFQADTRDKVMRIAPAPLYNSYMDVWKFIQILKEMLA